MDPITAISVGMGAVNTIGGIFGASAQRKQERQNYRDAVRFQKAQDEYAKFQAEISARATDVGNEYAYWQQLINYNQDLSYVHQLRNFELSKAVIQAEFVGRTRSAAMADYALQSQALSDSLAQASMADAVSYQAYLVQGLKARSALLAGGQEGRSVDRYFNDYARQIGDQQALIAMNQRFREGQYTREQAGQIANYVSRYNSQQFYQLAPYQEPIKPFAPLPTLVMPPAPSMTGAGPANTGVLDFTTSLLSGVQTGMSAWQGLQKFTGGYQPGAQPTSQFQPFNRLGTVGDFNLNTSSYFG